MAEYEMQLVEEMKLKNKALEIANKLAEASSAKDIAALEAAKAELLAQHEVKMKQIAADKAKADADSEAPQVAPKRRSTKAAQDAEPEAKPKRKAPTREPKASAAAEGEPAPEA